MTRVLVVEDEESYSDALAYMLRKEGFDVALAATGPDAIAEFERSGADIVLLDLMLPGLPGTEVCRQIRQTSSVPVIMVSAKDAEVDKVVGLELGADDYVTKPYSPRELRARIKAALRRSAADLPDRYRFGEVEVDFARHELRCAGRPIDVTALELKLLGAFIRHRGRVLNRQQLLDEVWGRDTFVTDRVVDNQVTNLRKKIEPVPQQPRYLRSVRGAGYRFDD